MTTLASLANLPSVLLDGIRLMIVGAVFLCVALIAGVAVFTALYLAVWWIAGMIAPDSRTYANLDRFRALHAGELDPEEPRDPGDDPALLHPLRPDIEASPDPRIVGRWQTFSAQRQIAATERNAPERYPES